MIVEQSYLATHTYVSPTGAVIVIRNVPARKHLDDDGKGYFNSYPMSVAIKLQKILNSALTNISNEQKMIAVNFETGIKPIEADLEIRFVGKDIKYGQATVRVWKKAFDRIYIALSHIQKTLVKQDMGFVSSGGFPVAYAVDGSLKIGIRDSNQKNIFSDDSANTNLKTLDIISQVALWLEDDKNALDSILKDNHKLLDAALKAVEELSPSERDEITNVDLSPLGRLSKRKKITLNSSSRKSAISQRITLAIEYGEGEAQEIVGNIVSVNVDGTLKLKNIVFSMPEVTSKTYNASYPDSLFEEIVSLFRGKSAVKISGIRIKQKNGRYKLEVMSIESVSPDSFRA